MKSINSDTQTKLIKRNVRLKGITDIMFDRYPGDNNTKLDWNQKMYLKGDTLVIPTTNMVSFLSAHNTNSAPKRLRDSRQFKKIANSCLSYVIINGADDMPGYIPFTSNGERVVVGDFGPLLDEKSGVYLHRSVARLEKGIPNPKERPVLPAPWELEFRLDIFPNREIKEQEVKNLISDGGVAIGLGTFRGVFGKFTIDEWSELD